MKSGTQTLGPAVDGLPVETELTGVPDRNLLGRVGERLGMFWCREFHRQHRQYVEVDERRLKVHCARCGRKFIRDRHYGYRVS